MFWKLYTTILIGGLIISAMACNNEQVTTLPKDAAALKNLPLKKEKWHWGIEQQQDSSAGYAQVIKVGNTLYISGIPTADISSDGITKLYADLGKSLAAFGADFSHVVKETLYTTDIEAMKSYNAARKVFYKNDFPAASWVQVSRLYEPAAKLEVDLIAVLPGGEN
jgi:enamine deaminase RidA (YjgF/YER057c/UK114 family)